MNDEMKQITNRYAAKSLKGLKGEINMNTFSKLQEYEYKRTPLECYLDTIEDPEKLKEKMFFLERSDRVTQDTIIAFYPFITALGVLGITLAFTAKNMHLWVALFFLALLLGAAFYLWHRITQRSKFQHAIHFAKQRLDSLTKSSEKKP